MENSIKVVLAGDSGVGKTSIMYRFVYNDFRLDTTSTFGTAFVNRTIKHPKENCMVNICVWDTAGQERYRSLATQHFQDADATILVYDITMKSSFDSLKEWIQEVQFKAPENSLLFIAANKIDCQEEDSETMYAAKKLAESNGGNFIAISAKENIGIKDLFEKIALITTKLVVKSDGSLSNVSRRSVRDSISLDKFPPKVKGKAKKSCCA